MLDGKEKRVGPKSKVLGKKTDFAKKKDAEEALRKHLKTVLPVNGLAKSNTQIKTFKDAGELYLLLKKGQWEGYRVLRCHGEHF